MTDYNEIFQKVVADADCARTAQELVGVTALQGGHKIIFGRRAHSLEEDIKKCLANFREALHKIDITIENKDHVFMLARAISKKLLEGM